MRSTYSKGNQVIVKDLHSLVLVITLNDLPANEIFVKQLPYLIDYSL